MTTSRTLMLLAAGLGAAALSGCGANVPANPSWVADVHPIMVARCIRCHNADKPSDPESPPLNPALQGNFDYASLDDFKKSTDFGLFLVAAVQQVSSGAMPPPPAAKLADWQIETITNFVNELKNAQ